MKATEIDCKCPSPLLRLDVNGSILHPKEVIYQNAERMLVTGWIKRVSSALNAFRAGYCAGTEMEMAAMISQILLPTLV